MTLTIVLAVRHLGIGPMSNKKFSTPPHHPYTRPSKERKPQENCHQPPQQHYPPTTASSYPPTTSSTYLPPSFPPFPTESTDQPSRTTSAATGPGHPSKQHGGVEAAGGGGAAGRANPEHFIFPDCTPDLQKEFFMFYMQKCLQQNNLDPPPYSAHG